MENVEENSSYFFCDKCEYSTSDEKYLMGHKQLYHEEGAKLGRHQCEKCEKIFPTTRVLRRHDEVVHQQIKHHFCDKCDFGSYEYRDLRKHVFDNHYDWKEHKDLHKCDICGEIIQTIKLYQHIKALHDKKIYFCDLCDFSRPYKTHVENHMKRVHEKIEDLSITVQTYISFDD